MTHAHAFRESGGPIVCYGEPGDEMGGATFSRTCPSCGRIVKSDAEAVFDGRGQPKGDNATCSQCGRVEMMFLGYP